MGGEGGSGGHIVSNLNYLPTTRGILFTTGVLQLLLKLELQNFEAFQGMV